MLPPNSECVMVIYDETFYRSQNLYKIAEAYLKAIPEDVTFLASAGASGCSIAAAILTVAGMYGRELHHVHIHPKGRESHRGQDKQFSGNKYFREAAKIAFVDDFMETGGTAKKAMEQLRNFFPFRDNNCEITCLVMGYKIDTLDMGIPIYYASDFKT